MSPTQMLAKIEAAPDRPGDYDEATLLIAKHMLEFARAHLRPDQIRTLTYDEFDALWRGADPDGWRAVIDEMGPTGFMVGWAYNAVRYCSELPPQPNPALLTI